MVETSSAVKLSHKNGRFNAIFPIARKTVQRRLLVCCFHWQCLIKMYSKVLYRVLKRNAASSISTDSQPAKLLPFDEAKGMISDVLISFFFFFFFFFLFFFFCLRFACLLLWVHDRLSVTQVWMFDWAKRKPLGGALSDSSVSSVYLWYSQPWEDTTGSVSTD